MRFRKLSPSFLATAIAFSSVANAADLTLSQAVSEAFNNSPKIQKAESSVTEASWKRVETYSGFLPSLSANANYVTNKKYVFLDINLGAPISIPQVFPTTNYLVTATMPLFDGFVNVNHYNSALSFEHSAESQLDWTRFQVEHDVTLQFYRALGARILQDVAEQNIKTLEDHMKDVTLFKKAGVSTNYDVLRVEVQVSEARSELLNAIDNVGIAKNRLGEILGKEAEDRDLQGNLPILDAELVKKADFTNLSARKDIQSLNQTVSGFEYQESSAGRYWVPRISLIGQYQYYNNRNDKIFDGDAFRDAYQVGFSLAWNIFDGMSSISRSKQSIEQRVQAEKNLEMARLHAKQDLEVWKRKFVYFCSIYKARANDIQKAAESVRLAREGQRVGSRTSTDLLDAESELFRARAGAVNAQIGAIEALINLELSSGQKLYTFN